MRVFLVLFALALAAPLSAQTFTFTAGAGDWTNGENWNNCIDPEIGVPCPHPLSMDHTAILPAGVVVTLDDIRFINTLRVIGNATLFGEGAVDTETLEITSGRQFTLGAEVISNVIVADATTEVTGPGRLRLTDGIAPVAALSVQTVECENSLGETCDLTGAVVTASALWVTGGGDMLVDGSAAAALDAILIDNRPLGGGGQVPGNLLFAGAPATFDLASIETVDFFGTVDFNGGSVTVADVALGSGNQDGLVNLVDLTVTGSMDWNGGTVETSGVFTIAPGALAVSRSNSFVKGRMEVAGILEWTALSFNLGSYVNDPTPAAGDLVILPSGLFRANNNANSVRGPGALVVQGTLRSDASQGPFPFPSLSVVTITPDSIAVDGGDVRVDVGTLRLNRFSPAASITVDDATFVVAGGATLDLAHEALDLDAETRVRGGGTLYLSGGSTSSSVLTSAADVQIAALTVNASSDEVDLSPGTVRVGTLTHFRGLLRLPGDAAIRDLARVGLPASIEFEPGGPHRFRSLRVESGDIDFGGADVAYLDSLNLSVSAFPRTLDNVGTFTLARTVESARWGRAVVNASEIVVADGVVLDLVEGPSVYTGALRNEGTVRHTAGDLAMNGPFDNNGRYVFDTPTGDDIVGSGAFDNSGVFERTELESEGTVGVAFSNAGVVRVVDGRLPFDGAFATTGTLAGTGTLALPVSTVVDGAVAPGLSPGLLTIEDPLALAADAVLDVELGGLVAGTEHDQLAVTGTAMLGGTLRVTTVGGFAPSPGQTFTLVTCGETCTGAFDAVELPLGIGGDVEVTATEVVLAVTAVGVSASRFSPTGPVVIGPDGGSVRVKVEISNPTGATVTTQTWTTLTFPSGATSDVQQTKALTLDPGASVRRATQITLQAGAAEGTYTYRRYVGTRGADTLAVVAYAFDKAGNESLATAPPSDRAEPGEATVTVGADGVETDEAAVTAAAPAASATAPTETALRAPYPNPASGQATVVVDLAEAAPIRLAVYDALGREVAVALGGPAEPGRHEVSLDTSRWTPGVYVVRLTAGPFSATERLTVVR